MCSRTKLYLLSTCPLCVNLCIHLPIPSVFYLLSPSLPERQLTSFMLSSSCRAATVYLCKCLSALLFSVLSTLAECAIIVMILWHFAFRILIHFCDHFFLIHSQVYYQPYFMLYGEVFADDIDPPCGEEPHQKPCPTGKLILKSMKYSLLRWKLAIMIWLVSNFYLLINL